MKYIVQIRERSLEVVIDADGVSVDGQRVDAHVSDVEGTPVHLVTINGEVHRAVARRGETRGKYSLSLDGYRYELEALDERTRAIRDLSAAQGGPAGPAPIIAPMPGLIVRVNVNVGDQVQPGQGLVVMEAMKMENELKTQAAGKVKSVLVTPGTAVEKGAKLVELE